MYLSNPENILSLQDTNLLLDFLDEAQNKKDKLDSKEDIDMIVYNISKSVSNFHCEIEIVARNKYTFPHLNCLKVEKGELNGNLDLTMFGEFQRLKCNNGIILIKGSVIISNSCSILECIRGSRLVLPMNIYKLNF